jgi:hypothetical protein
MDSEFPQEALKLVSSGGLGLLTCLELIRALQALITHDDDRPPASKALMHARMLALDRGAVDVFVSTLQRALEEDASVLPDMIGATEQLCANDEICKQVSHSRCMLRCHSNIFALNLARSLLCQQWCTPIIPDLSGHLRTAAS